MSFIVLCDWPSYSKYLIEILEGMEEYCKSQNIGLIILNLGVWETSDQSNKNRQNLYDLLKLDNYEGIISFTSALALHSGTDKFLHYIRSITNKPMVNMIEAIPGEPSIVFNNQDAFEELLIHLCDYHGYKDFVYISGSLDNIDGITRLESVKKIFKEYNISLPEERIFYGNWLIGSGKEGYQSLKHFTPKVYVCANDYMAQGVYNEALKEGLHIPEDIIITGFDNLSLDGFHDLPFTSVKQPFKLMGEKASFMLHQLINNYKVNNLEIIKSKLIIKESCGCWYKQSQEIPDENIEVKDLLTESKQSMMLAFKKHLDFPKRNYLVRQWNAIIQKFIRNKLSEHEMWAFLSNLIVEWHKKYLSNKVLIELNFQITRLERIIGDNINQLTRGMAQEDREHSDNTHIYGEKYRNTVFSSLNLYRGNSYLKDIFDLLNKKNVYIILYQEENGLINKKIGKLLFVLHCGKIINRFEETKIPLDRYLLPEELCSTGYSSLLVQSLYIDNDVYGYLIYDYIPHQTELNEYIRMNISSTIKSLKTSQSMRDNNLRLENEIKLRVESENKIQDLLDELKKLSIKDPLTELLNRRGFLTIGQQQIKQFLRENLNYIVMFCDMDGLKKINDTYGHKEGDIAIKAMAKVLNLTFRESDVIARLGGDEFTVLFGNITKAQFHIIEARMQKNLGKINKDLNKPYTINFSYGICCCKESGKKSLSEIMEIADYNLYCNKKSKQNQRKPL